MKKTLAIVLALAMVLCMIPAAFAAQTKTITDKSYDLAVESFGAMDKGSKSVATASKANSITFKYNYEEEGVDVTGKFTEDKKMGLVTVAGFDADLGTLTADEVAITVDGKDLQVNGNADYANAIGWKKTSDGKAAVVFPVELTKAGYTDSYVITVKGKVGDVEVTETAKVSLKLQNGAEYKSAKTATISKIAGNNVDAYIVGSKIYLDFQRKEANVDDDYATVKVTFKDENGSAFNVVTWAYATTCKVGTDTQGTLAAAKEGKLSDSAYTYKFLKSRSTGDYAQKLVFHLETASALYETKEYSVVVRYDVQEADPKGIYFADSTKTIKIGESYSPVVMGVATGKAVAATLKMGENTSKEVLDLNDDKDTVIGTKEGVAYITATYTCNADKVTGAAAQKTYTASSMKVIVAGTADSVADTTTYYVTCRNLNVRKGAGTSYAKAGMLHRGDKVEVVSISNNWAKLANGTYVCAKYIAK